MLEYQKARVKTFKNKPLWAWEQLSEPERQAIKWIRERKANSGEWRRDLTPIPGCRRASDRPFDIYLEGVFRVDGKASVFQPSRRYWLVDQCLSEFAKLGLTDNVPPMADSAACWTEFERIVGEAQRLAAGPGE